MFRGSLHLYFYLPNWGLTVPIYIFWLTPHIIANYFLQDFWSFRKVLVFLQCKNIFLVKLYYVFTNTRLNGIQFFFGSCYLNGSRFMEWLFYCKLWCAFVKWWVWGFFVFLLYIPLVNFNETHELSTAWWFSK